MNPKKKKKKKKKKLKKEETIFPCYYYLPHLPHSATLRKQISTIRSIAPVQCTGSYEKKKVLWLPLKQGIISHIPPTRYTTSTLLYRIMNGFRGKEKPRN